MIRAIVVALCLSCGVAALIPVPSLAQSTDEFTVQQLYGDDAVAPSIPAPVTATPIATTQIDVTWGASTDNNVLAGYRLFRDAVQIATTTLLTYSDTGLTPSTTYTYYVDAFDLFGNISTSSVSVSTTTFAAPPPAEDVDAAPQSTVMPPRLRTLDVDPGTGSARFTFGTLQPVTYILRYGTTDAVTDGFVQSDLYKKDHSTILTDLAPSTTYFYALYGKDRFGREVLLREDSFTTLSRFSLAAAPNVSFFTATVSGLNVLLQWGNPVGDALGYVRVVRSHYTYPVSPNDGYIVYEGLADTFYDEGALREHDRQYYTVFAYNIDGQPSSGAVALALRAGVRLPSSEPVLPTSGSQLPRGTTSTSSAAAPNEVQQEFFRLTFADITIVQFDELVPAQTETIAVVAGAPFVIRVPVALVPSDVRTVIVTWQHPTKADRTTSYLLRRNDAGTHFEAMAASMEDVGLYPMQLSVFDRNTLTLGSVTGTLEVLPAAQGTEAEETVLYVATTYIILGGIIGLLTMFGLWWLLLLLLRFFFGRRRRRNTLHIQ